MPRLKVHRKDYAVLIPTKGRVRSLKRLLAACPALDSSHTYIGLDLDDPDINAYGELLDNTSIAPVFHKNPRGITSVSREALRQAAVERGYSRYLLADDNCRFSDDSLLRLLRAQLAEKQGIISGAHPTAAHFHSEAIASTGVKNVYGDTIYEQVGMVYWVIPHDLYSAFRYPDDCYYDDIYLILWAMSQGFSNFKACLEARFDKHRHEAGGTGNASERVFKMALGLQRLAEDFPQWMVAQWVQTRVPWGRLIKAVRDGKKGFEEEK